MNNIGLIKYQNEIICTGFVIRVAISARDATLITGSIPENIRSKNFIFELNGKTYDVSVYHEGSSGLVLFIPTTRIDDLYFCHVKFEFPPREQYQQSTKYFIHDDQKCFQLDKFDYSTVYNNREGNVIINEHWEVFAVIVNQKCVPKDELKHILEETLKKWFSSH